MTIADRAAQLAADECRLDEAERAAFRAHMDRRSTAIHARRAWRDFEPQRIELVRVEGGWVAVTTPTATPEPSGQQVGQNSNALAECGHEPK
jgi:hypothetical protein